MIPTLAVREQMAKLLAADATTLAPVTPNKIALVKAPFTPSEDMDYSALQLADFDGSDPLAGVGGAQPESLDPNTKDSIIDIETPAGGFRWETTGTTNLPQTIYGFILTNDAGDAFYGAELLAVPQTLTAVNQSIFLPRTMMRQLARSVS